MTGVITNFTKLTVGRPRPGTVGILHAITRSKVEVIDVIDRCQPPAGSTDPTFGLTSYTICTQTDMDILKDGFRSFPSGHSSRKSNPFRSLPFDQLILVSFAGLGFLSFYLAGKLHLFDGRGHAVRGPASLHAPRF